MDKTIYYFKLEFPEEGIQSLIVKGEKLEDGKLDYIASNIDLITNEECNLWNYYHISPTEINSVYVYENYLFSYDINVLESEWIKTVKKVKENLVKRIIRLKYFLPYNPSYHKNVASCKKGYNEYLKYLRENHRFSEIDFIDQQIFCHIKLLQDYDYLFEKMDESQKEIVSYLLEIYKLVIFGDNETKETDDGVIEGQLSLFD